MASRDERSKVATIFTYANTRANISPHTNKSQCINFNYFCDNLIIPLIDRVFVIGDFSDSEQPVVGGKLSRDLFEHMLPLSGPKKPATDTKSAGAANSNRNSLADHTLTTNVCLFSGMYHDRTPIHPLRSLLLKCVCVYFDMCMFDRTCIYTHSNELFWTSILSKFDSSQALSDDEKHTWTILLLLAMRRFVCSIHFITKISKFSKKKRISHRM